MYPAQEAALLSQLAVFMPSSEEVRFIWQPHDYNSSIEFRKDLKKLKILLRRKTVLVSVHYYIINTGHNGVKYYSLNPY